MSASLYKYISCSQGFRDESFVRKVCFANSHNIFPLTECYKSAKIWWGHEDRLVLFGSISQYHFRFWIATKKFENYYTNLILAYLKIKVFKKFFPYQVFREQYCHFQGCTFRQKPLQASRMFLLGVFAKLRKVTTTYIMSVCPSVHMGQLGSHWTNFYEIWYLSTFQTYVEKIKVSLKSDKNNRNFTRRPIYICDHLSLSSP